MDETQEKRKYCYAFANLKLGNVGEEHEAQHLSVLIVLKGAIHKLTG